MVKTMRLKASDEALFDKIQELHFEVEYRKDNCATMINNGISPTDENFLRYQEEGKPYFVQLSILKQELLNDIIARYPDYKIEKYDIDFSTNEIEVTYRD